MPEGITTDVHVEGMAELSAGLRRLAWASSPKGMRRVLKAIGIVLERRAKKSFQEEKAPPHVAAHGKARSRAGRAWEPLADSTKRQRRRGRGRGRMRILRDTGQLRQSIAQRVHTMFGATAAVEVGASKHYGLYHQAGATYPSRGGYEMAPRPFLGYNDSDVRRMLQIVIASLRGAVG